MNKDEELSAQLAEYLYAIDKAITTTTRFLEQHNMQLFQGGQNGDLPEQIAEIKAQFENLHYKAILYSISVNFTNITQTALQTQSQAISEQIEELTELLNK